VKIGCAAVPQPEIALSRCFCIGPRAMVDGYGCLFLPDTLPCARELQEGLYTSLLADNYVV